MNRGENERLGQILTRIMLCGQHFRPAYDKRKRTITCHFKTYNQSKIIPASKYLSHFGYHSRPYGKVAQASRRTYFKLTFNRAASFDSHLFCYTVIAHE